MRVLVCVPKVCVSNSLCLPVLGTFNLLPVWFPFFGTEDFRFLVSKGLQKLLHVKNFISLHHDGFHLKHTHSVILVFAPFVSLLVDAPLHHFDVHFFMCHNKAFAPGQRMQQMFTPPLPPPHSPGHALTT